MQLNKLRIEETYLLRCYSSADKIKVLLCISELMSHQESDLAMDNLIAPRVFVNDEIGLRCFTASFMHSSNDLFLVTYVYPRLESFIS